jgi:hypothetical protein
LGYRKEAILSVLTILGNQIAAHTGVTWNFERLIKLFLELTFGHIADEDGRAA